ncbi:hypothetical protein [Nafulsella turpanensis]|uniref:hypothetical protein n=1 Tax=Nafulsella turpanensis TaxID=1265690 RepID=UPI00037B958A|nr:hypothetical protein [Nafulsella turpanensis]
MSQDGMKIMYKYLPLLVFLCLFSCKKGEEVLPDATQSGENTFGAYVNGELWVPKGRPSTFEPNFSLTFDPGYHGGTLQIQAYRVQDNDQTKFEYIQISAIEIESEGLYYLDNTQKGSVIFEGDCYFQGSEEGVSQEGNLEITRLDLEVGIIAGKFEFTLAKAGCDTIRVTDGRFDYQL